MSDETPAPQPQLNDPISEAEAAKRRKDRVEFIAAFLIGLAAVLTAIATFQGNQQDGKVRQGQNDALQFTLLANESYSAANSERATERDLFFRVVTETDEQTADFLFGAMPAELQALVTEWSETDDAVLNPFSAEADYATIRGLTSTALVLDGQAWDDDASCAAFGAAIADRQGETYGLSTVILAIALVVAGIAALLTSRVPQIMVLVISGLSLVGGLGLLAYAGDQADARLEQAAEFFAFDNLGNELSAQSSLAAANELCGQP